MMRRVTFFALAAALAVAACAQLPAVTGDGLFRIGAAALPIGSEKEQEIGFGIAATVAGRYRLLDDPQLNRYVNLVGQAVAQQSVRGSEIPFRFGVLDTDEVNAFAAPGGFIFITRGALALMESEADLAGVLAHEIAHVDQKHVLDEIRRSSVFQTVSDEADLRGPLLDRISEFGSSLLFTGLSREDELEADSLAVLYAAATGYRADGLVHFLQRFAAAEQSAGHDTHLREWRATHPSTTERLTLLQQQVRRAGLDAELGQAAAERFQEHVRLTRP
jgi:beta-barrel assembly-enhancing protease